MAKRIGLKRTQALLENLKRELAMGGTTFSAANIQGAASGTYGDGAVSGSTTAPVTRITQQNGEVITTITLDLTNLSSSGENGKIVGNKEAAADSVAPAYLMQWNTNTHGICYKVEMACVEIPAGNGTFLDFNLETDDAALEMGGDPSTNNVTILDAGGNFAAGTTKQNLVVGALANNQYIYVVNGAAPGATGDAQYTAGQFVIKFHGHKTF